MPCYTEPHSYCHHGIEDVDKVICDLTKIIKTFDSTRKREEGEFQDLKKHCDKLTDMLCRLCKASETTEIESGMPQDIFNWWISHKKWDKERMNTLKI